MSDTPRHVTRSAFIEEGGQTGGGHWAFDEEAQGQIASVARRCGVRIDAENAPDIFGVKALRHFKGSLDEAMQRIREYADERINKRSADVDLDDPVHHEAKAIVWTNVVTPDGIQLNVTAREGATADTVLRVVLEMSKALRELEGEFGFTPSRTRR